MFGVLKGAGCGMQTEEKQQWMGYVCGVCLALNKDYGLLSRAANNYDAALLSALCAAQKPGEQATRVSYCPLRGDFKLAVTPPDTPGVRYAASLALLMAAVRIRDHVRDGETFLRRIKRLAGYVSRRWTRAAHATADSLGFDAALIEAQVGRQAEVESQAGRDFGFYAEPTELAVAAAFAHTAMIAERPQNAGLLHEMGRLFGRIMYLLDSYQDYESDLAAARFNPLAACFSAGQVQQRAGEIFEQAWSGLKHCFERLDLAQPALLHKLLIEQLRRRGYRTLKIARRGLCSCGESAKIAAAAGPLGAVNLDCAGRRPRSKKKRDGLLDCCLCCCDDGCRECLTCCDSDCGDGCDVCCCDGDCDCGDCDCGDCDCGDCDCGDCNC